MCVTGNYAFFKVNFFEDVKNRISLWIKQRCHFEVTFKDIYSSCITTHIDLYVDLFCIFQINWFNSFKLIHSVAFSVSVQVFGCGLFFFVHT